MKTLLINFSRFGDLLQCAPTVKALREEGRDVYLACLENFAWAADFIEGLAGVRTFPGAALLASLGDNWRNSAATLLNWVDAVSRELSPSLVVNLTPSLPTQILVRLFKNIEVRGFSLDEYGFGQCSSSWAAFLQAASLHRGSSPFNLVDVFLRSAHVRKPADFTLKRPDEAVSSRMLEEIGNLCSRELASGYAVFQLGASSEARRWPAEYFAWLGDRLFTERGIVPVLSGGAGEKELGEIYAGRAREPFADLIGKTGHRELAAVLGGARLLVTNDTGTMHLAAGLGTPVLSLFFATAQPWDTGPYLEGALCVEPDIDCHPCSFGFKCAADCRCRYQPKPGVIYEIAREYLDGGSVLPCVREGVRLWRTVRDEHGFMTLKSLSGLEKCEKIHWIEAMRRVFRQFLDNEERIDPGVGGIQFFGGIREEIGATLEECRGLLLMIREQSAVLAKLQVDRLKTKLLSNWRRFQVLLEGTPRLAVLTRLWLVESQNAGQDLRKFSLLAERYLSLFTALTEVVNFGTNLEKKCGEENNSGNGRK